MSLTRMCRTYTVHRYMVYVHTGWWCVLACLTNGGGGRKGETTLNYIFCDRTPKGDPIYIFFSIHGIGPLEEKKGGSYIIFSFLKKGPF